MIERRHLSLQETIVVKVKLVWVYELTTVSIVRDEKKYKRIQKTPNNIVNVSASDPSDAKNAKNECNNDILHTHVLCAVPSNINSVSNAKSTSRDDATYEI